MLALDNLLDDYGKLDKAALRLEGSRDNHRGAHEFYCDNGRCLKCEESRINAEQELHEALFKVVAQPFPVGA